MLRHLALLLGLSLPLVVGFGVMLWLGIGRQMCIDVLYVSGGTVSFDGATRSSGAVHCGPPPPIGPATVP